MRRVLHEGLDLMPTDEQEVPLSATASHHLVRVLRLKPGREVELFDGGNRARTAVYHRLEGDLAWVRLVGPVREEAALPALHLGLALLKGPAMDEAVRMATEAGMTHLHPIRSVRVIASGDRGDRWVRIAEAAARQCGRSDLPSIEAPETLREVLARLQGVTDRRIALPGASLAMPAAADCAVLVGPEGGWTSAEIDLALQAGFQPTGLGRWVMRGCTAAPVAVALCAAQRS